MTASIRLFSFFAGAGFLDLGFEVSGIKVDFANEVHPPFLSAYMYSRARLGISPPSLGTYSGSIEDLVTGSGKDYLTQLLRETRQKSDLVGFIGGPPCPDFSVGGKNRGAQGDNGRLSAVYAEIICQQQPDFFLFENVKGLWKTRKHREFFETLKERLQKAGFITTQRLVNAIEYGAPQDRDRIILLGFHRRLVTSLDLRLNRGATELPRHLFPWRRYTLWQKLDILRLPWPTTHPFVENSVLECPAGIKRELTVQHWFEKNDVDNHPNSVHYFRPRDARVRFETIDEGDVSKKSFKRLHRWRYSPTVAYGNNEVHLHPYRARRLTVAEALALQSLPREYVLPSEMSLSDMFKTISNGVPFLMAKGLAQSLLGFLRGEMDEAYSIEHRQVHWTATQGSLL